MARTRMVVVGGDAAGMSSATQARRRRPAEELEIVAFERGQHVSYSACGLPYYAGGVVKDWRDLIARSPEAFADQDIEVRTRHEVDAIDLEARRVRVRDLDGGRVVEEPWDVLVVATGSEPLRPPIQTASACPACTGCRCSRTASSCAGRSTPAERAVSSAAATSAWRWPRPWSPGVWLPPWSRPPRR